MRCLNCGREFKPNRDWQKFCHKQCQQAWHRFQGKKAELVVAESKANGGSAANDAHRAKWAAIRAEWAAEDKAEERPGKFLRRF